MHKAIRLAIDLDGVLTEHPRPLAQAANTRYGLDLPDHAFVDSAGLNLSMAIREWAYGEDGPACELVPAPGAQRFLRDILENFGRDCVQIVTARPATARETTLRWLHSLGFPTCNVHFADDKVEVAARLGVTHAVEDSLRHATSYAAVGIRCMLICDAPPMAGESPAIIRVSNLGEAYLRLVNEQQEGQRYHRRGDQDQAIMTGTNGTEGETHPTERKRIVISDLIDERARQALAREAEIIDVDGTDVPALLTALHEADALIVRSETEVTRDVLAAGTHLRVVARAGAGVDNIDVKAATEAGILVLNTPGANAVSAGEHTIALLLALARQIPEANATTHAGEWERKRFKPFDLQGKTVGIVGLGRVGSVVAQRLQAFDMQLIGYDPYITRDRFTHMGVEPVSYETLLEMADIITFHVPATPETTHMLDSKTISRLRPGAIVLNCSRGEVVDDMALANALRSGHVSAAGVDVFPHEPTHESPLFGLLNTILTPHIGGSSREALAAVGQMISTTTLAALRGETVPNAVNLPPASLDAPDLRRLTHVAGAAGHLLAVLQPEQPSSVHVTVEGSVPADVVEHVTGAALSAALGQWCDRRVTAVNARLVAEELEMIVTTAFNDLDPACTPVFIFEVDGETPHRVTVRWDRTDAGIVAIDRFSLERPLVGDLLITHHHDRPGIVGRIGTILGRHNVNIAGMQVGRHDRGGEAIMVLNVDDVIPETAMTEIMTTTDVQTAYVVSLPESPPAVVWPHGAERIASE